MPSRPSVLLVVPNVTSFHMFLRGLAKALNERGVDVQCACAADPLWPSGEIGGQTKVHDLSMPRSMNPSSHWKAARALGALVNRLRPRLVHAHFSAAIFTTSLARGRDWPPTIGTFQGLSFPLTSGIKGLLLRTAETWAIRRLDNAWVINDDDVAAIRALKGGAVVHRQRGFGFGCDLECFDPARVSPYGRASMRARLDIAAGTFVFAFVGRFVGFKGFAEVVRAFFLASRRADHLRLMLVGGTDPIHPTGLRSDEARLLAEREDIVQVGWRNDVQEFLAIADAVVFPSTREGMPVCLMEALAMGVPVITVSSRGCREVVRNGIDGFVLREFTSEALAEKMVHLASDGNLHQKFKANALEARSRFDRRLYIAEQLRLYAESVPDLYDAGPRRFAPDEPPEVVETA